MSREKGLASFSANFEAQIAAPIDARMVVDNKNDLTQASTWTANDGNIYVYKGMVVSVHSDVVGDNNGLYRLLDLDYTQISNWEKIKSAITTETPTDLTGFIKGNGTLISASTNIVETDLSFTDVTTANATTSAHGLLPKLNDSTSNYLRGDGTWATPPNTTYSEITESEIDAGTASTGRTITGRRAKYILDKVANVIISSSAPSSAPTKIGNIFIDITANRFYIAVGTSSTADWRGVLTQ
jgi:hypothetical protein